MFYYKVVQLERAENVYLRAVAAKSVEKKHLHLFEAFLTMAWSFVTNWPYGLLSFMMRVQMETPSDHDDFKSCIFSHIIVFRILLSESQESQHQVLVLGMRLSH